MFPYSDPVGTGVLESRGALAGYRVNVHANYRFFAVLPQSAFTLLDAFEGVPSRTATIPWIALPQTADAPVEEIDTNRFTGGADGDGLQDEYVEWRVEKETDGRVSQITFVTEFPEYYEALAGVGLSAIQAGTRDAIPGANPTKTDIFGRGFDPDQASPTARQRRFVEQLRRNPWQDGRKGILCLQQRFNTMTALFNLVGRCAVTLPGDPADACANAPGGACGPARNSDPKVCTAAQVARRQNQVVSLSDPVGVRILELGGIWKLDGEQIDINQRPDLWRVERNGQRATLIVSQRLTLVDDPIESGAQVARVLSVGATIVAADESDAPSWARTGNESSRRIT